MANQIVDKPKDVVLQREDDLTNLTAPQSDDVRDSAEARWDALSEFGVDRPTGSFVDDIQAGKRVLLQRGIELRKVQRVPDMGERVFQFIASSDGIKRDGNRIDNSGWLLDHFKANPVFLWAHDYKSLPIGKHVDARVEKDGKGHVLRIWSEFCEPELNPFADRVRRMYEKGYLRAGSVGWIPLESEPIKDEEGFVRGFEFKKNELLEFSAVPVPADAGALVEAVSRGFLRSEDFDVIKDYAAIPKTYRNIAYTLSHLDGTKSNSLEEDGGNMSEDNTEIREESESQDLPDTVVEQVDENTQEPISEDVEQREDSPDSEGASVEDILNIVDKYASKLVTEITDVIRDNIGSKDEAPSSDPEVESSEVVESREPEKEEEALEVEGEIRSSSDEGSEEDEVTDDPASEESTTALEDDAVEAEEASAPLELSSEELAEVRAGAKISKENGNLIKGVISRLSSEIGKLEDLVSGSSDSPSAVYSVEDKEVEKDLIQREADLALEDTSSPEEEVLQDQISNALERIRSSFDSGVKEEVESVKEEPEEEGVTLDSVYQERLAKIRDSLSPKEPSAEPKSDYVRKLLDRLKS